MTTFLQGKALVIDFSYFITFTLIVLSDKSRDCICFVSKVFFKRSTLYNFLPLK